MDSGVGVIGELARSRRERAQRDAERPRSRFIEAVEHSEVLFYFSALGIPFEVLDPSALINYISEAYGAKLKPLDIAPLLERMSREEVMRLDDDQLMRRLVQTGVGSLTFEYGKFPLRNDFVIIRTITVNFESIMVSITGVTSVAEAIAAEVAEFLWLAAGVTRQWPEIAKQIKLTGYGTATRVNLDIPIESLLNQGLVKFLTENLTEGRKYAATIGRTRIGMDSSSKIAAVASLDELHLKVDRFDLTTGAWESNIIRFSVTARNDYGLGRVLVASPLDYTRHEQFLEELFEVVRDS